MRKDARRNNASVTRGDLQGYHGARQAGINYAFCGFRSNKYFTSDRTIKCNEHFQREDGKPMKGYGLEIETGFALARSDVARNILANIMQTAVFPTFPDDLFKMQEDGSISGVECITQVMTKEFIRNHYKDFKTMYNDLFPMFGIRCDDGSCGMHVNISNGLLGTTPKTQEASLRKLYYIINKHYDFFKAAFYRTGSTTYCGRMSCENAKTMDVNAMPSSHYNSFNGSHFREGRIEIRLVGGQKNFACFRNTMEVVFHIVDAVKDLSWADCDDLTKIFKGCNKYVFDRIKSRCYDAGSISLQAVEAIKATVNFETEYL